MCISNAAIINGVKKAFGAHGACIHGRTNYTDYTDFRYEIHP